MIENKEYLFRTGKIYWLLLVNHPHGYQSSSMAINGHFSITGELHSNSKEQKNHQLREAKRIQVPWAASYLLPLSLRTFGAHGLCNSVVAGCGPATVDHVFALRGWAVPVAMKVGHRQRRVDWLISQRSWLIVFNDKGLWSWFMVWLIMVDNKNRV